MKNKALFLFVILVLACLALCACDNVNVVTSPSTNIDIGGQNPNSSSNSSLSTLPPVAGNPSGVVKTGHFVTWHRKKVTVNNWKYANHKPDKRGCVLTLPDAQNPIEPDGTLRFPSVPYDCEAEGYDSLDIKTIEIQNREFLDNGIVPVASWWGPEGSPLQESGDIFLKTYLSVKSPVQIGLLYEAGERLLNTGGSMEAGTDITRATGGSSGTGAFDFSNPMNVERFVADINHLHQKFFANPQYSGRFYRYAGRPILFIWLTHAFDGNFEAAAKMVDDKVSIWCSDFNVQGTILSDRAQVIRGCDVLTSYGIYDGVELSTKHNGHVDTAYMDMYEKAVAKWSVWLSENSPKTKLVLPIQFNYLDNRGNPEMESTAAEAEYQMQVVRRIVDRSVKECKNVAAAVFIDSINESYENSSVEPGHSASTNRNGTGGSFFLDLLKRYLDPPVANSECPAR